MAYANRWAQRWKESWKWFSKQNNSVRWPFHQIKFQYSQNNSNTSLLLKLRERLYSNPNSRCILTADCIRFITPGSRNVFMDVKEIQKSNKIYQNLILNNNNSFVVFLDKYLPQGRNQTRLRKDQKVQLENSQRCVHTNALNFFPTQKQSIHE